MAVARCSGPRALPATRVRLGAGYGGCDFLPSPNNVALGPSRSEPQRAEELKKVTSSLLELVQRLLRL